MIKAWLQRRYSRGAYIKHILLTLEKAKAELKDLRDELRERSIENNMNIIDKLHEQSQQTIREKELKTMLLPTIILLERIIHDQDKRVMDYEVVWRELERLQQIAGVKKLNE